MSIPARNHTDATTYYSENACGFENGVSPVLIPNDARGTSSSEAASGGPVVDGVGGGRGQGRRRGGGGGGGSGGGGGHDARGGPPRSGLGARGPSWTFGSRSSGAEPPGGPKSRWRYPPSETPTPTLTSTPTPPTPTPTPTPPRPPPKKW